MKDKKKLTKLQEMTQLLQDTLDVLNRYNQVMTDFNKNTELKRQMLERLQEDKKESQEECTDTEQ